MHDFQNDFIRLALERRALRFGEFTLKSGRLSPYFFNAGLFNDGASLARLGRCYAAAIQSSALPFDMLFGPAYKGIPLVAATAVALADAHGRSVPWAFNRKEAKEHGEAGAIVGTPLAGRVLIVDDVISAGTSVRESVEIIRAAGATPAGVVISLDRQERGLGALSAAQEVSRMHGIPVIAVATLDDIVAFLSRRTDETAKLEKINAYRAQYGVFNP